MTGLEIAAKTSVKAPHVSAHVTSNVSAKSAFGCHLISKTIVTKTTTQTSHGIVCKGAIKVQAK